MESTFRLPRLLCRCVAGKRIAAAPTLCPVCIAVHFCEALLRRRQAAVRADTPRCGLAGCLDRCNSEIETFGGSTSRPLGHALSNGHAMPQAIEAKAQFISAPPCVPLIEVRHENPAARQVSPGISGSREDEPRKPKDPRSFVKPKEKSSLSPAASIRS